MLQSVAVQRDCAAKYTNAEQVEALRKLNLSPSQVSVTQGSSIPFSIRWTSGKQHFDYTVTRSDKGTYILVNGESGSGPAIAPSEESVESSCTYDMAAHCDDDQSEIQEVVNSCGDYIRTSTARAILNWHARKAKSFIQSHNGEVLRHLFSVILKPGNTALRFWSLAFAANLDTVQGRTMTSVAHDLKVTRQAVSKLANEWCDLLELPRSRYMKSEKARKAYSVERKNNHWRHGAKK